MQKIICFEMAGDGVLGAINKQWGLATLDVKILNKGAFVSKLLNQFLFSDIPLTGKCVLAT